MIFPNNQKESISLNYPYADLLRKFNNALLKENRIFIFSGYGFKDNHINNMIKKSFESNLTLLLVVNWNDDIYEDKISKDFWKEIVQLGLDRIFLFDRFDGADHRDDDNFFKDLLDLLERKRDQDDKK